MKTGGYPCEHGYYGLCTQCVREERDELRTRVAELERERRELVRAANIRTDELHRVAGLLGCGAEGALIDERITELQHMAECAAIMAVCGYFSRMHGPFAYYHERISDGQGLWLKGDARKVAGHRLVCKLYAAPVPAQPAIPAEVGRAVQILRKHNEWRRGADNNHWQATPYSPAELGRAINTVCDHVSHSAQPDVLCRATEYAHDIVTWIHRDHYADNTAFEPFGDLLGLLSQIDNMICGWKEHPAAQAEAKVADGWVLVPREPTEEMVIAALKEVDPLRELIEWTDGHGFMREDVRRAWSAMLAAKAKGE